MLYSNLLNLELILFVILAFTTIVIGQRLLKKERRMYALVKVSFFAFVLLVFTNSSATAQQSTIYTEEYVSYRDGLELYDKAQYSAAQEKFAETVSQINNKQDEVRINAEYYVAVCALELFNKDAEHLLNRFAFDHPDHPKAKKVHFQMGKYYYRTKKFKQTITYFNKVDIYDLSEDEKIEYNFKLAYSYFYKKQPEKAKVLFHEVIQTENNYSIPAHYYYGHIAYTEGNPQTALVSFKKIENEQMFKAVVPYYITQIYYSQEKYDQLLAYAPPYMDSISKKRKPEFAKLIGDSYYNKEQYKEAIPYLMQHRKSAHSTRQDAYQLGYAHYKLGECKKANVYLNKAASKKDTLAQTASYHLADSYLKTGQKNFAKNAFKTAGALDFDKNIQKNSNFNYAKLAYELSDNPYSEPIEAFNDFIDTYPNDPLVEDAYEFLLKVYMTTKNYKKALKSLERIKVKDNRMKMAYQSISYNLAVEQFYNEKYDLAISSFQKAQKYAIDKATTAESYYWMGESNFHLKKYTQAISNYVEFKLEPGAAMTKEFYNADYAIGYAYFMKSSPFHLITNFDDAATKKNHNELLKKSVTAFRNFTILKDRVDQDKLEEAYLRTADCYYLLRNDVEAIKYYDFAIKEGKSDMSYAYYQKSLSQGAIGDHEGKAKSLADLAKKYPNSSYRSSSILDLAGTYLIIKEYGKAITKYKEFVAEYPNNANTPRALANIGVSYFKLNDYTNAKKYSLQVLDNYPNDKTEKEKCIQTFKSIYEAQNDINGYYSWLASRGIEVKQSEKDSALWEPVQYAFDNGDCDALLQKGNTYIDQVTNPSHEIDAHFYLAQCYYAIDKNKALTHYNLVIDKGISQHYEEALQRGSFIAYENQNWQLASEHYSKLETVAVKEENIRNSVVAQMYCYKELHNNTKLISYSEKVINIANIEEDIKIEATLFKGLALKEEQQYQPALTALKDCYEMTTSIKGAEAKFNYAEILFLQSEHSACETTIMELVRQKPAYDFWIAHSIILLGKNYMALEDYFNAKHSLQSVIDNYEGKDQTEIIAQCNTLIAEIEVLESGASEKSFETPEEEIEFEQEDTNQPNNN